MNRDEVLNCLTLRKLCETALEGAPTISTMITDVGQEIHVQLILARRKRKRISGQFPVLIDSATPYPTGYDRHRSKQWSKNWSVKFLPSTLLEIITKKKSIYQFHFNQNSLFRPYCPVSVLLDRFQKVHRPGGRKFVRPRTWVGGRMRIADAALSSAFTPQSQR